MVSWSTLCKHSFSFLIDKTLFKRKKFHKLPYKCPKLCILFNTILITIYHVNVYKLREKINFGIKAKNKIRNNDKLIYKIKDYLYIMEKK